eukprot:PRCOL_00002765-RA
MRARLRAGAADPSRSVIERAAEEAVLRFQLDCDRDTDSSDGEGAGRAGLGACQSGAGLSQRVEEAARAHGSSEAPASGTVASVASPPRRWPSRRLAGAGFAASASKDSYVDRLVAREIEQARASADESARSATRLRARADQLRREAAQLVVGSHGRERACKDSAATGRGQRLCARRMTERELGAAFEWMRLDQTLPAASAVRFWDKAAESLMELFEGDAAAAAAAKSRAGGGSAPSPPQRLYGYFNADGGANAVPLGFAALKVDGASVDVMGVRVDARGGGVGQAIVEHLLELANGRALRMREEQRQRSQHAGGGDGDDGGSDSDDERARLRHSLAEPPRQYVLDSIPSALGFWKAMGFTEQALEDVDPETRVLAKFSGDTRMIKTLPWAAAEDRRSARENARHAA